MASTFSVCATCRFRLSRSIMHLHLSPGRLPIRGKKKNAKNPKSLDVRLSKDYPGYGRKGSIVPVPIGQMRNYFYRHGIAEYVTWTEAKELKKNGVSAQRDFSFTKQEDEDRGGEIKEIETSVLRQPARPTQNPQPMRIDINRMEPIQAHRVISRIVPPTLNFYRAPIEQIDHSRSGLTPQPSTARPGTLGPATSMYPSRTSNVYGSVTAADVATNLKALIASNRETAGRVVLSEEDIRFVSGSEDGTRVKSIGDFDIEVKIKGVGNPIRRKVQVLPEEQAPVDKELGDRAVEELAAQQPLVGDVPEEVIVEDAKLGEKLEEVENMIGYVKQMRDDVRTQLDDSKMTPAEAAESDIASRNLYTEGVQEMDGDAQTPQSPPIDPSHRRRQ